MASWEEPYDVVEAALTHIGSFPKNPPSIIIDFGFGFVKVGFTGVLKFPLEYQTDTLHPHLPQRSTNPPNDSKYLATLLEGDPGESKSVEQTYHFRLEIMKKIYEKFGVDPKNYSVILTVREHDRDLRTMMADIMFNELQVPALYMANETALSLLYYRKSTGIVVLCGHTNTSIVAFQDCKRLPHDILLEYGWSNINRQLMSRSGRGPSGFVTDHTTQPFDRISYARRNALIINRDYIKRRDIEKFVAYRTVQEDIIDPKVSDSVYDQEVSCDGFFSPHSLDLQSDQLDNQKCIGIQDAVFNVVKNQTSPKRGQLLNTVVLCGGGSMLPSLAERLWTELDQVSGRWRKEENLPIPTGEVSVFIKPHRQYSGWLGANVIAHTENFEKEFMIQRSTYCTEGDKCLSFSDNSLPLNKYWY